MSQALSQDVDDSLFGPESEAPPEVASGGPTSRDGLDVKFYQRPVLNEMKSWGGTLRETDTAGFTRETKVEGAGREIYDLVDYVKIRVPGDKLLVQDVPARVDHKKRWPELWQRYAASKSKDGTQASGTPLEMASFLNPALVEELKFQRIRTVEQLAGISDGTLQAMGMGMGAHRDRARAFVEAARGAAPMLQMQAEIKRQQNEMEVLKAQLAEQVRLAERAHEPKPQAKK